MQSTKDKKGQVSFGNITGAAMAIGVLIVVTTIFAILVTSLGDTQASVSRSIVNETHTSVMTNVSFLLDNYDGNVFGWSGATGTSVINGSTAAGNDELETYLLGNFTFFTNGTVDLITAWANNTDMNFSYDFTSRSGTGQNITNNGLEFFQNLTGQVGLLGTILILVLIIVIIIAGFAFGGRGKGSL